MTHNMRVPCNVLVVAIFLLLAKTSLATETYQNIQPLDTGWSYYWEDLPFYDVWLTDSVDWTPLETSEVPGRPKDNSILWLKLDLPAGQWRDPYVFVDSIDLTVQVFENDQMTYEFGHISPSGQSEFQGWPWHLIPVTTRDSPTELYFRFYSNYPYIGLSGEVLIGERSALIQRVYERGMSGMVFIIILLVAGILVTTLGLIKRERRIALSTGLLSFDLVLMMFSENELSQVLWFEPLFWRHLAAFTYFLVPFFICLVVHEWFSGFVKRIAVWVCTVTLIFIGSVIFLSVYFNMSVINAYGTFDALFILMVLTLLVGCVAQREPLAFQDKLVIFGILALFLSLLLDMLSAHKVLIWIAHTG